jgi:hypothetical protein
MPCSYNAYIDASSTPAKIRIETTCSIYGEPVERLTGSWLLEPKGGHVKLEYSIPREQVEEAKETPCTPKLLPQPWPPYSPLDAEIVVDTRPGILLYGLPERRSTVLTLTQRTLLAGRTPLLQLVSVKEDDIVDDVVARVEGWLVLATLPPLASSLHDLEDARHCGSQHPGLEGWSRCIWEKGRGYTEKLLLDAPRGPWCRVCLYTRLYAGSLAGAGVDPLYWARRVRGEAGPWSPLRLFPGGVLRVEAPRARIALSKLEDGSWVLREEVLGEGVHSVDGWDAVGLACRFCLEPLRG